MLKTAITTLVALAATAGTADAREWPTTRGWRITQGDAFCLMTNEYRGPGSSMLVLALNDQGPPILADVNARWTAREGETYEAISLTMNGRRYSAAPRSAWSCSGDGASPSACRRPH